MKLKLFAAAAEKPGGEAAAVVPTAETGVQQPVFLADKVFDLLFPVHHHAGGHGLHTPRGKAGFNLFPQQRRQLIAHDAVKDAPGLLGIHQILVDGSGVPDALRDHLLGDLVEGDAPGLFLRQIQQLLQMPGDRLPLPVRVSGQIHGFGGFRVLFQLRDQFLLVPDGDILWLEAVLDIHAHFALGQVAQVSHGRLYLIVPAQIFFDGLCLRRRFDDDKILCFCHYASSLFAVFKEMRFPGSRRTKPLISSTVSCDSTLAAVSPVLSMISSVWLAPLSMALTIFS